MFAAFSFTRNVDVYRYLPSFPCLRVNHFQTMHATSLIFLAGSTIVPVVLWATRCGVTKVIRDGELEDIQGLTAFVRLKDGRLVKTNIREVESLTWAQTNTVLRAHGKFMAKKRAATRSAVVPFDNSTARNPDATDRSSTPSPSNAAERRKSLRKGTKVRVHDGWDASFLVQMVVVWTKLAYPTLCDNIATAMYCRRILLHSVLSADVNIECSGSKYKSQYVFVLFYLWLLPIGLLLLCGVLLYSVRKEMRRASKEQSWLVRGLKGLYGPYRPGGSTRLVRPPSRPSIQCVQSFAHQRLAGHLS